MSRIRRHVALAGTSLVLTASLIGCGVESGRTASDSAERECPWEPDTSVTTEARIAYQNIPNADAIVRDQGILEACLPKARITWTNFASGGDVVQAFGASGDGLDLGLVGSSPATKALSAPLDIPVKVIWIHDVIGEAESLIAKDPKVTDLAGLKGSRIAVPFGSTAHYSLLQALADAGIDSAKDVKIINLEPEKMQAAWQRGDIDAAWVWDPVLSTLKEDGHVILSSKDTAEQGKPTYDLGIAGTSFLEENPEFVEAWAKAQDWAVKLIADDPGAAAESVAAAIGVDPAQAEAQFAGLEYLPAADQASDTWLGGKLGKDLAATAAFLKEQGGIDAVAPEATYAAGVDAGPAASVK